MVEKDVVLKRLALLEEYIRDLQGIDADWETFRDDKIIRRFAERTLHMAIEACLDIAGHIISYEGYREPRSNRDTFQVLFEQGLLPRELNEQLQKMAQFRNVIVHDYVRVQPEIVFGILQNHVTDIVRFAQWVNEKYIDG